MSTYAAYNGSPSVRALSRNVRDCSAVHTTLRLARGVGTLTIEATLRVTTSSRTAALNALCSTIHA